MLNFKKNYSEQVLRGKESTKVIKLIVYLNNYTFCIRDYLNKLKMNKNLETKTTKSKKIFL